VFETPEKHSHFDPTGTPVLMSLVYDNELPVSATAAVKQGAIIRPEQEILEHRVVCKQYMRRRRPHFRSENQFAGTPMPSLFFRMSPRIPFVFRRLSRVLSKCKPKRRAALLQSAANISQAISLITGEGIHRIENERPDTCAQCAASELRVEVQQDGKEKCFGLAATRAGSDNCIPLPVGPSYSFILMFIKQAISTKSRKE
jgi:hypothetical protein